MPVSETELRDIRSRQDMIRFFDGYGTRRVEELAGRRLLRPLVKTQLLEATGHLDSGNPQDSLPALLQQRNLTVKILDRTLFYVSDPERNSEAFIEPLNQRILAVYSTAKAREFDSWVRPLVQGSSKLDYVWLSGLTFNEFWKYVVEFTEPYRYVRLSFSHERIFDVDSPDGDERGEEENEEDSEDGFEYRTTTSRLSDRLREIKDKLGRLQELYSPFFAISQLRLPSTTGRGGHDFYDNGRVTNRGKDFLEHRSQVSFVADVYEQLLRLTEEKAWYGTRRPDARLAGGMLGAPVSIQFQEPLNAATFQRWVAGTFGQRRNRFRLWGAPTYLGPTKAHVHAVDHHLWQPVHLELTATGCIILLPQGSCGNIVHRLVTNVQRYIDPGARAFVGSTPYEELVGMAMRRVLQGGDSG